MHMCGRFSLTTPVESVRRLFGFNAIPNLPARYNIAPTQAILAVTPNTAENPQHASARDGVSELGRRVMHFRWGLVPSWAKEPSAGGGMINARAETMHEKPSFRAAFRRRRCLIPADSFYEWRKYDQSNQPVGMTGGKQPYRIGFADGEVFAFAGLWETWAGPDGSEIDTCAIVTTSAAPEIAQIHHRMPVILDQPAFETWLLGSENQAQAVAVPYHGPRELTAVAISTRVNSARNDGPDLWEPANDGEAETAEADKKDGSQEKLKAATDQLSLF